MRLHLLFFLSLCLFNCRQNSSRHQYNKLTIYRLQSDGKLVPAEGVLWPSLPNPLVQVETFTVQNPREISNESEFLVCDITIKGVITSPLCDVIPGEHGKIDEIFFNINSSETDQQFPVISKKETSSEPTRPYPFRGTFNINIPKVPITEGNNVFTLSARDKIYGINGQSTWTSSFSYDQTTQKVEIDSPPSFSGGSQEGELFLYCLVLPENTPEASVVLTNKDNSKTSFPFQALIDTTPKIATWPETNQIAYFTVRPTTSISIKEPFNRQMMNALKENSSLRTLPDDRQFLYGFHQGLALEGYDIVFDSKHVMTRAISLSENSLQLDLTLPLSLANERAKPMVSTLSSPAKSSFLKPTNQGSLANLHQHLATLSRQNDPLANEIELALLIPNYASIGLKDEIVGDWSQEFNSRLGNVFSEFDDLSKSTSPVIHGLLLSRVIGDSIRPYLDPTLSHRLHNTSTANFLLRLSQSPAADPANRSNTHKTIGSGYFATPNK